jgi:hypothetical protein
MSGNTLKVAGLNDFRRGLKRVDADLPKSLRVAFNGVTDILITATRPKIPVVSGAARASLRANSTQTAARLAVGGPRAPYYPWLDFGGKTGRKKSVVRPFYRAGRYIYPTLAEQKDAIEAAMLAALAGLATGAGLEVD